MSSIIRNASSTGRNLLASISSIPLSSSENKAFIAALSISYCNYLITFFKSSIAYWLFILERVWTLLSARCCPNLGGNRAESVEATRRNADCGNEFSNTLQDMSICILCCPSFPSHLLLHWFSRPALPYILHQLLYKIQSKHGKQELPHWQPEEHGFRAVADFLIYLYFQSINTAFEPIE